MFLYVRIKKTVRKHTSMFKTKSHQIAVKHVLYVQMRIMYEYMCSHIYVFL